MTYETNIWRSYFESIAKPMLNETLMVFNYKHRFRIIDCEFYFNDGLTHHDTFLSEIINSENPLIINKLGYWSLTEQGLFLTFGVKVFESNS